MWCLKRVEKEERSEGAVSEDVIVKNFLDIIADKKSSCFRLLAFSWRGYGQQSHLQLSQSPTLENALCHQPFMPTVFSFTMRSTSPLLFLQQCDST